MSNLRRASGLPKSKTMINIDEFISGFSSVFAKQVNMNPWSITSDLTAILNDIISGLDNNYSIQNGVAIHKSARVEDHVILKSPVIIGPECFIGSNAYLRNGVYLEKQSSIGPGCEVKTSIIFEHTEIAHFNFIGDSIIGSHVNFEAGSITANYFNERTDKTIPVLHNTSIINSHVEKFGSLVGDNCKIGANAVLSPGTILNSGTVVKRLQLIEQIKE